MAKKNQVAVEEITNKKSYKQSEMTQEQSLTTRDAIAQALYKKAIGYQLDEVIEEYAIEKNNEIKLVKRKVTTKQVPPDTSAVKTLLEFFIAEENLDLKNLTDEQLEAEKQRLMKMLQDNEEEN